MSEFHFRLEVKKSVYMKSDCVYVCVCVCVCVWESRHTDARDKTGNTDTYVTW